MIWEFSVWLSYRTQSCSLRVKGNKKPQLLDSTLNIVQVSSATRDITFGVVILAMLFLYGRAEKVHG